MSKKEPIKISFKTALIFIIIFSVIMIGLGIYVQILKRDVQQKSDVLRTELENRKSVSNTQTIEINN